MKENHFHKIQAFGQSIWLDYIRRDLISQVGREWAGGAVGAQRWRSARCPRSPMRCGSSASGCELCATTGHRALCAVAYGRQKKFTSIKILSQLIMRIPPLSVEYRSQQRNRRTACNSQPLQQPFYGRNLTSNIPSHRKLRPWTLQPRQHLSSHLSS